MERGSRKRFSSVESEKMERVGGRWGKIGHCSTGQSPQWAVVSMEEEEGQEIFHISWNPKAQYPVHKSP